MKRCRYLIPLGVAALVGFGLQAWCQSSGFDPVTRLVVAGSPALLAVRIFFWAVPVLALVASLPLRGTRPAGAGELFGAPGRGGRFLGLLAGLLAAAGGLLRLAHDLQPLLLHRWSALGACLVDLLLCLGGACLGWLVSGPQKPKPRSVAALIPGFGACFWLITFYHTQSRDPIVVRYVWTLLCLMAAVLALYHQAAYCFGRPAPVRTLFFTLTAGAWAFGALPSSADLSQALLLTGLGCWMLLQSYLVPNLPDAPAGDSIPEPEPPAEVAGPRETE